MPTPLSKLSEIATIHLGAEGMQREPKLATWITNIVIAWPHLENQLGFSLARFLVSEARVGVAIYNGLFSGNLQRDILERAAKAKLANDKEDLTLFLAILRVARSLQKKRNPLAHEIWGSAPEVPGWLLCIKAELQLQRRAFAVPAWNEWLRSDPTVNPHPRLPQLDRSKIMAYSEKDFAEIYDSLRSLIKHTGEFWQMRDNQPPGRAQLRSELESAPLLREPIRQIREEDQKTQKSPPPIPPPAPTQE